MLKTNKKKNIIKYILIIFIILIPYFLSGESNRNKNNQYNINKLNHKNISLKKRIYLFFYQRKNYALIKRFFLKKKQFIIIEYIFKKKDYKKALIYKALYNKIIKKIALCNFDLAINGLKIDAEEQSNDYLFLKKKRIKYIMFLRNKKKVIFNIKETKQ